MPGEVGSFLTFDFAVAFAVAFGVALAVVFGVAFGFAFEGFATLPFAGFAVSVAFLPMVGKQTKL